MSLTMTPAPIRCPPSLAGSSWDPSCVCRRTGQVGRLVRSQCALHSQTLTLRGAGRVCMGAGTILKAGQGAVTVTPG